jgi:hypothetical protein
MGKPIAPDVIALVFGDNGTYVACTTGAEVLAQLDAVLAAGGTPVLFHRNGHSRQGVVNISTGGTGGIQARDIHGGVRF